MDTVYLPCSERKNRECHGHAAVEDLSDYEVLTSDQKAEVKRLASEYTKEDGDFDETIDGITVRLIASVCGPCGSDYHRDRNGEIIDD